MFGAHDSTVKFHFYGFKHNWRWKQTRLDSRRPTITFLLRPKASLSVTTIVYEILIVNLFSTLVASVSWNRAIWIMLNRIAESLRTVQTANIIDLKVQIQFKNLIHLFNRFKLLSRVYKRGNTFKFSSEWKIYLLFSCLQLWIRRMVQQFKLFWVHWSTNRYFEILSWLWKVI